MQTRQIQMNDVIYNAAEQCFEALVTVHDGDRSRKYACAINAPMTMSFDQAAKGLTKQAERRHISRGGMYSEIVLGSIQKPGCAMSPTFPAFAPPDLQFRRNCLRARPGACPAQSRDNCLPARL